MIFDTIQQCDRYASVHARLPAAFRFLRTMPANLPDGRHDIDGDRLFALVQSYTTSPAAERKLEHHRKYADVQYVIAGEEIIEHAPLAGLAVDTKYDDAKDFGLVRDPAVRSAIVVRAEQLAVFFPEDAHKPGCAAAGPASVRKVVVKALLRQ